MGKPPYRAKQLRGWLYKSLAVNYREMTDLPLAFRSELENSMRVHTLEVTRQVTGQDGTVKALFTLADGETIEAALMVYRRSSRPSYTVCVSTQAGCAIGCPFCATGQQGFRRNLTAGEIIDQVLYFARYLKNQAGDGEPATRPANIVLMGMGEPLANYDALWQAVTTLNSPDGFGLGARNMTISTAGLVPQIKRLGREKLQVGLAVSLHAGDNILRNRLVPINRKYPLDELIPACRDYYRATGRRVSFEYVLFKGINDSVARARALAGLLRDLNCHVNLIPANLTSAPAFRPPPSRAVLAFAQELRLNHINATLRQPRGQDIAAGCGQLRRRLVESAGSREGAATG